MNIQKSAAFLHLNNKISEKKYEKASLSKSHKKILRNKPDQGGEDLNAVKYKTLTKEIKDDSKKWKDTPSSCLEKLILKWPYYPKQSTDLM